jgi:hypothetical protein
MTATATTAAAVVSMLHKDSHRQQNNKSIKAFEDLFGFLGTVFPLIMTCINDGDNEVGGDCSQLVG